MIAPSAYEPAPSAPPQPSPAQLRIATPQDDAFVDELQALARKYAAVAILKAWTDRARSAA